VRAIYHGSKYHMTLILSSFITYHRICNQINTSTTSGTGATYLSRAPEFTPVFSGVCSSPLKHSCQMNKHLVGSTYGKICIRFPQNRMKDEQQSVLAP
jgi:hypothetical protein